MKLFFKIHKGTKEIGGSCVEVCTESTRILLDFGMPLVEKDRKEFNFSKYKPLKSRELVEKGILPNIEGLYDSSRNLIDGVIISYSHQDHYGLANFINENVQYYLGEATHKIIELNNLFTLQEIYLKKTTYFNKETTFKIGDISITPYLADHSASDAYSFLVEAYGKSLFYSGDFRSHGRKAKVFYWFTHNAPQNVDYLLLEGTTINRGNKSTFFVSDTGIGISPENQKFIFKAFRQVDERIEKNFDGSELVLAISKAIIELHGGKIWLKSDINKGTTFYFKN